MFTSLALLALIFADPSSQRSIDVVVENAQVSLIDYVRVPAEEVGTLAELKVKEGDVVEKGQILGHVKEDLARIEEQIARYEFEIAKKQSENDVEYRYAAKSEEVAAADLRRAQESNQIFEKAVSDTEIDRYKLMVERATLSKEQAELDMDVADLNSHLKDHTHQAAAKHLERRTITAPLGGKVEQVFAQEGEWLNLGDPLLRIIRIDRLRVEGFVDGTEYGEPELRDRPVTLTVQLPPARRDYTYEGRIVFVSSEINPFTNEVRVFAEVENHDARLLPGAKGKLTITLSEFPYNN